MAPAPLDGEGSFALSRDYVLCLYPSIIPRKLCKYHNWLVKIFFTAQVSSQNPDWKFSLLLSSGLKTETQSGGRGRVLNVCKSYC